VTVQFTRKIKSRSAVKSRGPRGTSSAAVDTLRRTKNRPAKPFALLVPLSGPSGLEFARSIATLSVAEEAALLLSERPIVIVKRRAHLPIVDAVAPGLDELGIMLPYSPLLHLILDDFKGALVATSGNISGEPILSAPAEAELHLSPIASGFLHHDRSIARATDDSVVRVIAGRARLIRVGRGSGPIEMVLRRPLLMPTLAIGALQKNTIALAWGNRVAITPHVGDLTSLVGQETLLKTIADFESLYGVNAKRIAYDAHPGVRKTHLGDYGCLPSYRIWHHFAHASAIAGEFPSVEPMLCFTWDANGFGEDRTLWGGEALLGLPGDWVRVASFRPFPLLGGDLAGSQPWRSALGMCWEAGHEWSSEHDFGAPVLRAAYEHGINCPKTSAVGRLFDAAAAILGLCLTTSFSAQAAMRLEALCLPNLDFATAVELPLTLDESGVLRTDWEPLLPVLLDHSRSKTSRAQTFHASLALALCRQAIEIRRKTGVGIVGLGGGVFQNRVLTELIVRSLAQEGFLVRLPVKLPVNDAAISFGQIIELAASDQGRPRTHQFETMASVA